MTKRDILIFLRLVSRRSQVFSCHEDAYDGDDEDDNVDENAVTGEKTASA